MLSAPLLPDGLEECCPAAEFETNVETKACVELLGLLPVLLVPLDNCGVGKDGNPLSLRCEEWEYNGNK